MKTYKVFLTKAYVVTINAKTIEQAKRIAEFYTNDVQDISIDKDRKKFNFSIKEIDNTMNESFGAEEIKND